MKNTLKKHFLGGIVFLSTIVIGYIGYAAYSNLPTQIGGTTITATLWNDVINKVNDIGSRVDGIYSNGGNIGIGTSSPGAKFEVSGTVKITDGTQGAGKVLTSDANGMATWGNPSDSVLNNLAQYSGALPQAAGSTVVGAGSYYDFGDFNVTSGVYMWFVYNCSGQLTYASGQGTSYQMVGTPVIYSSSNRSNLNNSFNGSCGTIYTGVVKANATGIIHLRLSSYNNSVLVTSGPTSTAFTVTLVKIN